jgi:hypothetical protein
VGASDVGELDGEAADAAARAGDQHAPRDRVAPDVESQQGGDPGDGERRGLAKLTVSGRIAMAWVGTAASCAQAWLCSATTRVPSGGPLPSAAGRRTVPARSQPVRVPAGLPGQPLTRHGSARSPRRRRGLAGQRLGVGASVSSTPGSAEEVSRASIGVTLPIGIRGAAVRESLSWTRTPPGARRRRLRAAPPRVRGRVAVAVGARSWPAQRARPEDDCGLRTPLQRDRDRIVHSKAFRGSSTRPRSSWRPRAITSARA